MASKKTKRAERRSVAAATSRKGLRSSTIEEEPDGVALVDEEDVVGETEQPGDSTTRQSEGSGEPQVSGHGSPLTTIPEDDVGDDRKSDDASGQSHARSPDGQRNTAEPRGATFADEVADLMEDASGKLEEVQNGLLDCLEAQDNLTNKVEDLRMAAKKQQDRLETAIKRLRRKGEDELGRIYADPDDVLERSRNALFREREYDETSSDYGQRRNAQNRFMAREHYEAGVRERDRKANQWWHEREHGPNIQERGLNAGAPEPSDDGSSNSSSSHHNSSRRDNNNNNNPFNQRNGNQEDESQRGSRPPDRRDGSDRNAGRGAAGGNPGGPPGPPSSSGEPSNNGRDRKDRRVPRFPRDRSRERSPATLRRAFERSPSYLHDRGYPLPTDRWSDPNADFIEKQLNIIRRAIRDRVDHEAPEIPAMKNLKNVPAPEKYSGKDDAEDFMSWLKLLLRWMELSRIVGPDLDGVRVNLLGQFLIGAAREWYDEIVDNIAHTGRIWVFEDAVCAMFTRFIHKSTARTAADKFHSAKYKKETGVNGLFEYMVKQVLKMPSPPDDYTFNRTFVRALPEEIGVPMFQNRNASMERTPPTMLKRIALEQELSNRVVEDYKAAHRKQNTSGRETSQTSTPRETSSMSARPLSRPSHQGSYSQSRREDRRPFNRTAAGDRGQYRRPQEGVRTFDANRMVRPGGNPQNRQGTGINTNRQGGLSTTATAGNSNRAVSTVKCYNCHEMGHIAPNCPKSTQPKLRMARAVSPDEEEEPAIERNEENVPVEESDRDELDQILEDEEREDEQLTDEYGQGEGSQYDSAEEVLEDEYDEPVRYLRMMRRVEFHELSDSESEVDDGRHRIWTDSSDESVAEIGPPSEASVDESEVEETIRERRIRVWRAIEDDFMPTQPIRTISTGHAIPASIPGYTPAEDPPIAEDEYDDMPSLEPLPEAGYSSDYVHHQDPSRTTSRLRWDAMPIEQRHRLEDQDDMREGQAIWDAMLDDPDSDEAEHTMYCYWRGLVLNNRLLRSSRESQRTSIESLRMQLAWYRRELARSIEREMATIDETYQALLSRSARLQDARHEVRAREEANRMLVPDELEHELRQNGGDSYPAEWDYMDDPSMASATIELSEAVGVREAPPTYQPREPALRAMTVIRAPPTKTENMKTRARVGRRPMIPRLEDTGLTMYLTINGLEAIVLFDSGSTGDSISPEFARVSGVKTFELENPTQLQLGCSGSRSMISHGTQVPLRIGETAVDVYLDVVNLDRYDVVLGTPFMRRLGVVLDFGKSEIQIQGQRFPALTPLEEDAGAMKSRRVTAKTNSRESTAPAIRSMRTTTNN